MRFFPAFLSLLFALLTAQVSRARIAMDPTKAITQYTDTSWTTNTGLPQNSITAIAQTNDGYIWLGTEEGLVRFDGVRFTAFDKQNTPGLLSNEIQVLLVDKENNLWVGTSAGLARFRDGQLLSYYANTGSTLSLCEDGHGVLWIGTDGAGLKSLYRGKFKTYSTADGLPRSAVFAIAADGEDQLWLGTHAGLANFKAGRFQTYTKKNGLPSEYVKALFRARDGSLWIGTREGGLTRRYHGRFTSFGASDGMASKTVLSVMEDSTGSLWIGTSDAGLSRYRDGRFVGFGKKEGLTSDRVLSLFQDR
ncbi:MAG: hypothetical protein JO091_07840, partial [Acidobacteriaceae bacterium]|nr:hypothetical protein [Acidobacteriaceae bacterium]